MTKPLTTRGPFDPDPGVLVRWLVKSGQRGRDLSPGAAAFFGDAKTIRGGIQLYIPAGGRVVELDFKDAHEAGDLYVALEAHMENIAAPGADPVEEARMASQEEREAMTPNGSKSWRAENLEAIQEQIDNPIPVKSGATVRASFMPRMTPRRALDSMGDQAMVSDVDPEFLGAMADVVEAWTNNGPHASAKHDARRHNVKHAFPALAAALDRLANLNA